MLTPRTWNTVIRQTYRKLMLAESLRLRGCVIVLAQVATSENRDPVTTWCESSQTRSLSCLGELSL